MIAAGSGNPGSGAAAFANFNPTTGTITGITVTSPGSGYTSAPIVKLYGGYGTSGSGDSAGPATATAVLTGGVPASGAVTFSGVGTTTLNAANTYSGGTTISAGTVALTQPLVYHNYRHFRRQNLLCRFLNRPL